MAKDSDAPIRLAAASVVKALFVQSVKTKEETSSIAGKFGERVKAQVESGHLHTGAFNQAAAIFRKMRNNEIKAREHLVHLDHYLQIIRDEMENAGHVGDLDRMSKAADDKQEEQTAASAAAEAFAKEDAETEANRAAAREKLELAADGSDGAPPPPPEVEATPAAVDKPKRGGRKPKAVEPAAEAAPPPPPPALKDDDEEEDIRPGFLRQKEADRKAGVVH